MVIGRWENLRTLQEYPAFAGPKSVPLLKKTMLVRQVLLTRNAFIIFFVLTAIPVMAQTERLPSLVRKIQPSVVSITTYDEAGRSLKIGSGFFVLERGDVVTNRHVLEGASRAEIKTRDGKFYPVSNVVAEDKRVDLVQISVEVSRRIAPLKVASHLPDVGERVLVVGSPLGLEQTVSEGIVSAVRNISSLGTIIQITAPVSVGSSGSPVVNMEGEVIGVATFQLVAGQNLNFAIPAVRFKEMEPMSKPLAEWNSGALQSVRKKESPLRERDTVGSSKLQGVWAVQVDAFADEGPAQGLVERLKEKGYDAYIAQVNIRGRDWYRVRVGRFPTRDEAETMQETLQTKEKLTKGFVISE